LKDVSFEVAHGEAVGIIGRNGAGKSTLLKILSQITGPTNGKAKIYGRVGSLLEVTAAFHPELTGRENTYLNGAILGMRKNEIASKFDEIVAFAEIEKFIDTPVKHYSSGMRVRLAFAIYAHLEPEILLIDEVLAVGDARFQRKCLNKMQDAGQRTVLFVSHNMAAVTRLCSRAILLHEGTVLSDAPIAEAVSVYLRSGLGSTAAREWSNSPSAPGNEIARLRAVRIRDNEGKISSTLDIRCALSVEMEFEVLTDGHVLIPNYHFLNEEGVLLFVAMEQVTKWKREPRPKGRYISTARIPGNFLAEGTLLVGAAVSTMNPVKIHFFERDAVAVQIVDSLDGDSARGDYGGPMPGVIRPVLHWTSELI
ncbi:MAG TPA: ABC transporter ATP-binding protein, partial [Pyrinomonadaceae bacterium]|nr:ABC transporter ATP-binding protein [Pyrinomonadaceae bacterium]